MRSFTQSVTFFQDTHARVIPFFLDTLKEPWLYYYINIMQWIGTNFDFWSINLADCLKNTEQANYFPPRQYFTLYGSLIYIAAVNIIVFQEVFT